MKFRIDAYLDNELAVGLFKLYLSSCTYNKTSVTKAGYIEYVRNQIGMFGTDHTSCLGGIEEYDDLTEEQYNQLVKWGAVNV